MKDSAKGKKFVAELYGASGWIKGKADIIVFERSSYWLLVDREELLCS
jgi:hypothetical protein